MSSTSTSSQSAELSTQKIYMYTNNIHLFKSIQILLSFHLPKWQNITDAAICSYLQRSQNEAWQAPVIVSASYPFIAQNDCCTHKPKHTETRCTPFLGDSPAFEFYLPTFRNILFLLPAYTVYEDRRVCSENSAYVIQTLGKHLKERTQHSERAESFKSRNIFSFTICNPQ